MGCLETLFPWKNVHAYGSKENVEKIQSPCIFALFFFCCLPDSGVILVHSLSSILATVSVGRLSFNCLLWTEHRHNGNSQNLLL